MDNILLMIADISIHIRSMDCRITLSEDKNYMVFRNNNGSADYDLNIYPSDDLLMDLGEARHVFSWNDCWSYYLNNNGDEIYRAIYTEENARDRVRVMIYNKNSNLVKVYITLSQGEAYVYRYGELLLLWAILIEKKGGIIVHTTACLLTGYGGIMFCGKSGSGKSTIARILENYYGEHIQILSDDRAVLRCIDGKVKIYGTPWHSSSQYYLNEKGDLKTIFFISHGEGNLINDLSVQRALLFLVCNSFCTFWYQFASKSNEIISCIVDNVDSYVLDFLPDCTVADCLSKWLKDNG